VPSAWDDGSRQECRSYGIRPEDGVARGDQGSHSRWVATRMSLLRDSPRGWGRQRRPRLPQLLGRDRNVAPTDLGFRDRNVAPTGPDFGVTPSLAATLTFA